jgi:hypothetical protein
MEKPSLTAAQVATRLGVSGASVRAWCKRGLFPNAELTETLIGPVWLIPESDLISFTPPKIGRPSKAKVESSKVSKKGRKK